MKNRKGRREEGLLASCSAQPARPATGPASHRPAPPTRCSQPAARLTRPSLRPSVARQPRLRSLPPWPRVSAARCPCPCVSPSPLAAAACWTPHVSATMLLPHAALKPPRDRAPIAMAGWARGHARGMDLSPLGAAPTQPLLAVGCKQAPRLPLIPVQ